MAKPHILILEDEPDYYELLIKVLTKAGYEISHATNLKDALGLYYSTQPDLAVVDIFLNGQPDGIAFAQKINENQATKGPFLFLTSSFDKEVFTAAKLTMPYSYLLKPFNPLELNYAIELALEKFSGETGLLDQGSVIAGQGCFFIKQGEMMTKILPSELNYIEVDGRYCDLWTLTEKHQVQSSLKDMLTRLTPAVFLRVHRNYAVNFDQVRSIAAADGLVVLKNGKQLPLSRRYLDDLKKRFSVLA